MMYICIKLLLTMQTMLSMNNFFFPLSYNVNTNFPLLEECKQEGNTKFKSLWMLKYCKFKFYRGKE